MKWLSVALFFACSIPFSPTVLQLRNKKARGGTFLRKAAKRLWLRLADGGRHRHRLKPSCGYFQVLLRTNGLCQNACSQSPPAIMILHQISYLDCVAFLVFLVPQLLIQTGLIPVLKWLLPALPSIGEHANIMAFAY